MPLAPGRPEFSGEDLRGVKRLWSDEVFRKIGIVHSAGDKFSDFVRKTVVLVELGRAALGELFQIVECADAEATLTVPRRDPSTSLGMTICVEHSF